jgi:methionyl-tRNA formyltransferase
MRIAVLCATRRGLRFLQKLKELAPENDLIVFSFPEEPWEPKYLEDIRQFTLSLGDQFFQARQPGNPRWSQFWERTTVDLMFAVNWRYLLPASIYLRPRLGTFVFHDSLLPEYRGYSPTVWAIINGEDHTGVTLFEASDEFDAGNIIAQKRVPIGSDDAIGGVLERVTQTYLDLLEENLESLLRGTAARFPQDQSRSTYTSKRLPEDNEIDWAASSESISRLIRAVGSPYPGAYTFLQGEKLRIWSARLTSSPRRYVGRIPGRIVEVRSGQGAVVLTGDGCLLLTEVQTDRSGIVCAAEVLKSLGHTLRHSQGLMLNEMPISSQAHSQIIQPTSAEKVTGARI